MFYTPWHLVAHNGPPNRVELVYGIADPSHLPNWVMIEIRLILSMLHSKSIQCHFLQQEVIERSARASRAPLHDGGTGLVTPIAANMKIIALMILVSRNYL
jgi:hypothetical protein